MPKITPPHWKKFEKFLLSVGCKFDRERGDHRIFYKEGIERSIVVPRYNSLPIFIVLKNLKTLGISREEYLKAIAPK